VHRAALFSGSTGILEMMAIPSDPEGFEAVRMPGLI
jgi:hypothetical protein